MENQLSNKQVFEVGEKVRCIKNHYIATMDIVAGNIYIVKAMRYLLPMEPNPRTMVRLEGMNSPLTDIIWPSECFESIEAAKHNRESGEREFIIEDLEKYQKAFDKTFLLIEEWAGIDGSHHKQWLIDQIVRSMLGTGYDGWVKSYNDDEDYEDWDVGIAP